MLQGDLAAELSEARSIVSQQVEVLRRKESAISELQDQLRNMQPQGEASDATRDDLLHQIQVWLDHLVVT